MNDSITVSIPAQTGFIHVVRAVTCGVAARLDFSIDEIDDLRLAVDEATAQLLSLRPPASTLTISLTPVDDDRLELVASCDAPDAVWPPGVRESLGWQVLLVLADELSLVEGDGRRAIRLTKRRAPHPLPSS